MTKPIFKTLGRALDRESLLWLEDERPDIANALREEIANGADSDSIRRFVIAQVGAHRTAIVDRVVAASRYVDGAGHRRMLAGAMKLLDLFSGAGGAAKGYQRAGFYVVGVDIKPQPHYCGDEFVQADALEYVAAYGQEFDVIHASPPCQAYSSTRSLQGNTHPELIEPVRELLRAMDKPYVIENVPGAPLINPVTLVGTMFGLRTMRPRLFECSFEVPFMLAPSPDARIAKLGHKPKEGEFVHVIGHAPDVEYNRKAMGIDWMTRDELSQAIPPAYTEFIGKHLMENIAQGQAPGGCDGRGAI